MLRNNQTTRKAQQRCSQIIPQPFEELEAKYSFKFREPTAVDRARFDAKLEAESRDLETWWPDTSRAILEDVRSAEHARRCAEDDLLRALKDAGLLKASVRRHGGEDILESVARTANALASAKAAKSARPKYSRAALLYLERQKARS